MKTAQFAAAALLLALFSSGPAMAHGRVSIGIGFGFPIYGGAVYGGPFYGPRYYGSPHYYPPYYPAAPVIVSPPVIYAPPPTYVTPPAVQTVAPPPPSGVQPQDNSPYWYYCPSSSTYYPYVRGCSSDWQQITPPQPAE